MQFSFLGTSPIYMTHLTMYVHIQEPEYLTIEVSYRLDGQDFISGVGKIFCSSPQQRDQLLNE
jgi:hypothetical protein